VTFATGTFNPQTTWLFIELDTDRNPFAIAMPVSFLGFFGNDQVGFDFRVYSSSVSGGPNDYMPDLTLQPAHVQ
jgi:hypothetical protein